MEEQQSPDQRALRWQRFATANTRRVLCEKETCILQACFERK